jgi:EAL domain-containing protein (putative c-di-GMP-specific phosphodiesterase class I)
MRCTASIGIACFPEDAASGEELQRSADLALYKAKIGGKNRTAAFTPQLLEDHQLRHRREAELRQCITSAEIDVWYQPIFDLRTGRSRTVEALARMKGGDGQYLPADVFIPLAEEIGLIRDLGRQVLRVALRQSQGWIAAGLVEKVAVNVSADEFLADGFADDVLHALACVNMSGDQLVLEITESVMMARLDVVCGVMSHLSERGVSFALDDFGCGYTNLAYLRQLSVNKVKLDLSLLTDVAADPKAQAIVRHVVSLCKELGSVTVCEGIETVEQLDFVQSIGCDLGQGYLLARPLSAEEAGEHLRAGRNRLIAP